MRRALLVVMAALALGGCVRVRLVGYAPPVLPHDLLPDKFGMTMCSYNNLPVVLVDSAVLRSPDGEMVMVHETVHARRMLEYRGGCWPFVYRYTADRSFRVREELAAYCEEGRFALTRNRRPEVVWARIVESLARDTTLTDKDNCLFEPWRGEG